MFLGKEKPSINTVAPFDNNLREERPSYRCGNCVHSEDVIVGGEIIDCYCWLIGTYRDDKKKYYKCGRHTYGGTKRHDTVQRTRSNWSLFK